MSRLTAPFARHLKSVRRPQPRPSAVESGIEAALQRAKEHHDKGEFAQAEKLCVAVLARQPRNPKALLLAGSLAHKAGDVSLAVALLKKAAESQPDSAEIHLLLASACVDVHEYNDAVQHFQRGIALKPNRAGALVALGRAYTAAGTAELALPVFEKAMKLGPNHGSVRFDRANALISLGRMDEAAEQLLQSIALGLRIASCYRVFADTQKFTTEPVELHDILEMLKEPSLSSQERMELHIAAGKILNDLGRYDEAVENFQASKAASGYRFDIDAFRQRIDTLIAGFTPLLLKSKASFGDPTEVPVFIVGMPRSGTTLTEQICASHPAVHGAGELITLGSLIRTAGYTQAPNGSIQKPPHALSAEEARSTAAAYLKSVRRTSPLSDRIVDKMPHNFMNIGMIALLFPNARIIHCTRDPIDNCISCFFNTFNEKHGYNTDLHTLGLYYREYKRLMDHWNALLPGRIHECNYEAMIADQEAESRRLIDFLGLPWDDACLRYYETDRSVTTPSRWQVRQPIYKSSVKRWKKYENKIQPLIEALGDLADV